MRAFFKRHSQKIVYAMLIAIVCYGLGRLYFQLTAGFLVGNITKNLHEEPNHQLPGLSSEKKAQVEGILNQKFHYLGKGCQSYVFMSEDKNYVIKFIKLQKFTPQWYIETIAKVPKCESILAKKTRDRRARLDTLLGSLQLAYEKIPASGIIYLHLNENDLKKPIQIVDKLGVHHTLDPNHVMFLLQRSATLLSKDIADKMASHDVKGAKHLLDRLLSLLVEEYKEGYGDEDHALLQNTGVVDGEPIHIDVGQFKEKQEFKDEAVYKQELFNKTYRFRKWLLKTYPELEKHFTSRLREIIGPSFDTMTPQLKIVEEGD